MSNNQQYLIDVHTFDGLLQNKFIKTISKSKEEKISLFRNFILELKNPVAIQMIENIIDDIGTDQNFQPENNLDCSDILVEIISKDYKDIISIIEEQLIDMFILGKCPSGRCTRLLSIYLTL